MSGDLPTEDYEDLYENAPCGYMSLGTDGRIVKVNATFTSWLGIAADQLIGKRMHDLLNIAGRIFYETHFAPLLRMQGFFNEVALDFVTARGERMPVLVNATERRDASGEPLFVRLTVFKAADRRRYERELVDARAAAEAAKNELRALNEALEARIRQAVAESLHAAEELKLSHIEQAVATERLEAERALAELREQFIAILGHDLRNPLAAISAGIDLMLRQPQNEKAVAVAGMMRTSVTRMSRLISDVLDFARSRLSGGFEIVRSLNKPLETTLDETIEEFRSLAADRVFESSFNLSEPVSYDASRMAQLISNLVGNALTHGAPNTAIRIGASTHNGILELWVANQGEQISQKAMARLFQPFFRGEARHSQNGLGLGLHIAWEIARAHGGEINVTSVPEETRFVLRMPVAGPAESLSTAEEG